MDVAALITVIVVCLFVNVYFFKYKYNHYPRLSHDINKINIEIPVKQTYT